MSIGHDNFGFASNMDIIGNKYRTYILVESLEEITTKDKIQVVKLTTDGTTSEAAAKDYLIQEQKKPIEEDKKDIKEFFNLQLLKYDFKQFNATTFGRYGNITFDFLQNVYGAVQKTTDLTLEARMLDKQVAKDPTDIPEHVTLIQNQSSSYSFTRYPYSGNPAELENVSDLDAIALKMAIALLGKGGMALVHLEQYLADVANMVGYGTMPIASFVQLKLMKSLTESRIRSRLSSRKPFEQSATFQAIKATPFFAKEETELAKIWIKECNGGEEYPTPRQVLVGLYDFYRLHLEKELRGSK